MSSANDAPPARPVTVPPGPPASRTDLPPGLHIDDHPPLDPPKGEPARVVLVHGSMDRGGSFGRVRQRLRDVEVVTYDRRGYARSIGLGPSAAFDEHVTDLLAVLGGRPAVVAGHSFGGNVVLTAAQAFPDLIPAAVVFEAPAPWAEWWPSTTRRSAEGRTSEDVAEAFMRRMVGDRVWDHLPATTRAHRRAEGVTLLAELAALGDSRPYDPARVTLPVVVGWGSDSPTHMQRAARLLLEELPDATGVEVPGSDHGVHLSHARDFAAMIRTAIDLTRPAAGAGVWAQPGQPG